MNVYLVPLSRISYAHHPLARTTHLLRSTTNSCHLHLHLLLVVLGMILHYWLEPIRLEG